MVSPGLEEALASTRTEAEARSSKTKFCSDCVYCVPTSSEGLDAFRFSRCARAPEKTDGYALTHPEIHSKAMSYCRVEREITENHCGPDAKWFKPKESTTTETIERDANGVAWVKE